MAPSKPLHRLAPLILALLMAAVAPLCAAEPNRTPLAPEAPWRIGRIFIRRHNVFDTGTGLDHRFPYAVANKIHFVTTEHFIRSEILFREGDVYDSKIIEESERILRRRPILRSALITPRAAVNGVVDIDIETEDVWTTNLDLDYGLAGGKTTYDLGFLERNVFGSGRAVGAFVKQDIDRFVKGVSYADPHFAGTRWEFLSGYGQDQKGHDTDLQLQRPYYSSYTPHSEGTSVEQSSDEDRRFEQGDEVATFHHDATSARAFSSVAIHPNKDVARRVSAAYEYKQDLFNDLRTSEVFDYPTNRRVSAVLAGFSYERFHFIKEHGVLTFDREEDINLGWKCAAEAGPSLQALGATRDGAVVRFTADKVWVPRFQGYVFTNASMDGRYERERLRNAIFQFDANYFIVDWYKRNTASLRANYVGGRNLEGGREFLLGAENGLRAYSVRQFSGNKKALFILENRQIFIDDWLRLATLGWAVFFDTGAVWKEGELPSVRQFKSDVGIGLRWGLTRSVDRVIIRTDVAYALNDNLKKSPVVLSIGGDIKFGEIKTPKFVE